jgi:hypothetical protein
MTGWVEVERLNRCVNYALLRISDVWKASEIHTHFSKIRNSANAPEHPALHFCGVQIKPLQRCSKPLPT